MICKCGNLIRGRQAKHCSRQCYNGLTRRLQTKPKHCDGCFQQFARPAGYSAAQWESLRYCSTECSGTVRQIENPGQYAMSRAEVAEKLGLTVAEVTEIEERALRKLRNNPIVKEMRWSQ